MARGRPPRKQGLCTQWVSIEVGWLGVGDRFTLEISVRADVWEPAPRNHETVAKLAVFRGVILEATQNTGRSFYEVNSSSYGVCNAHGRADAFVLFCHRDPNMLSSWIIVGVGLAFEFYVCPSTKGCFSGEKACSRGKSRIMIGLGFEKSVWHYFEEFLLVCRSDCKV